MLRPWIQLVRLPAAFSSMSNAFAGFWIGATIMGGATAWWSLVPGVLAAALFLMGGMALNDIADAKVDARERPGRPIPSGRIPLARAWMLVLGCFAAGLLLQLIAAPAAAAVGLLLVAAIFLYNFVLKGTWLGPLSMGLCRVLNLAAGIALCVPASSFARLPPAAFGAFLSLWVYVGLVTFLARDEVQGNAPGRVKLFFGVLAAWYAAWAAHAATTGGLAALAVTAVLVLHFWLLKEAYAGLRGMPASPASTGRTVGGLLGTLPATDALAMLAAGVAAPWALAALLWILPARWLARRIAVT